MATTIAMTRAASLPPSAAGPQCNPAARIAGLGSRRRGNCTSTRTGTPDPHERWSTQTIKMVLVLVLLVLLALLLATRRLLLLLLVVVHRLWRRPLGAGVAIE